MSSSTRDRRSSRAQENPPFRPAFGQEFDVQEAAATRGLPAIGREFDVQEAEATPRAFLARLIALTTVAAVAAAGGYGLITGSFNAVIAVWSVAGGPISGALVTYYFGRPERKDTG